MGYYNTFVVKIWCDDGGEMIRGHIQHVSTQEYMYFPSPENMTDFIVSHLSHSPKNPVTRDKMQGGLPFLVEGIGDINQNG